MEPRLIDNFFCNSNLDPDCQVYPLEDPNKYALNHMLLLYIAQMFIPLLAFGAGSTAYEDFSSLTIIVLVICIQIDFFFFFWPSLFILATSTLQIFPKLNIRLIERVLSNTSFIIMALSSVLMFFDMIFTKNPVTVRAFLTYVPLAVFSQYVQISLGVDAIRLIDSDWDEHRGPLYPALWYKWFSLYEPDASGKGQNNKAEKLMSLVDNDGLGIAF